MGQKKFALRPLLAQRKHEEDKRRTELAQAQRARDVTLRASVQWERRCDEATWALARCASHGNVAQARAYDRMSGALDRGRERANDDLRVHDGRIAAALTAFTTAHRERRTLERLRERLAARRMPRYCDEE